MSTSLKLWILFLTAASWVLFQPLVYSAAPQPVKAEDLARQTEQLETLWEQGKTQDYYLHAKKIADAIAAKPGQSDFGEAAKKLLGSLLTKSGKPADPAAIDLVTLQLLTRSVFASEPSVPKQHNEKMLLLAQLLGRVRGEMIPGYTNKTVVSNVKLPPGVAGIAGMDPKEIKNPASRAQYEAAIAENQQNAIINSRQTVLRNMNNEFAPQLIAYLAKVMSDDSLAAHGVVLRSIEQARLTPKEKANVLAAAKKS